MGLSFRTPHRQASILGAGSYMSNFFTAKPERAGVAGKDPHVAASLGTNESFRVLKAGGRLAITDNIATAELPEGIKNSPEHYSACISGAALVGDLENMLKVAGFEKIRIEPVDKSRKLFHDGAKGNNINDFIVSVTIEAFKADSCC